MPSMNAERKAEWVAALKSGEYGQANGVLRAGDGYCCLGVLCDLAEKAGVITSNAAEANGSTVQYGEAVPDGEGGTKLNPYSSSVSYLPEAVRKWAGLDNQNPSFRPYASDQDPSLARYAGEQVWLSNENDSGKSFEHIARLIEMYF